jgi:hypothetical protein
MVERDARGVPRKDEGRRMKDEKKDPGMGIPGLG